MLQNLFNFINLFIISSPFQPFLCSNSWKNLCGMSIKSNQGAVHTDKLPKKSRGKPECGCLTLRFPPYIIIKYTNV